MNEYVKIAQTGGLYILWVLWLAFVGVAAGTIAAILGIYALLIKVSYYDLTGGTVVGIMVCLAILACVTIYVIRKLLQSEVVPAIIIVPTSFSTCLIAFSALLFVASVGPF